MTRAIAIDANPKLRVSIRWMIPRDYRETLAIERASSAHPMKSDELALHNRRRNRIGMVAECGEHIVGFMIYDLFPERIQLLDFAVHPEFRRRTVGRQMAERLAGKLSPEGRDRIEIDVRESNLGGQLFLKAMGFRAAAIVHGRFVDVGEDGYEMAYRLEGTQTR